MNLLEAYKQQICTNCANEKCKYEIKQIQSQDICIEQIYTTTSVKCENFKCKEKRKKKPLEWQRW